MEEKDILKALVQRLQNNDLDAFDELYNLTKKQVYYAIYTLFKDESITEDLMQEAYIDFLDKVKKIKEKSDVIGYLVLSAKNKAINYYNKEKYEKQYSNRYINESYSVDSSYDTGLIKVIKETLDDKEFDVFILKVLGEYSFKEISKLRKIPLGTATWLYQEARKKLEVKIGGSQNVR